MEPPHRHRIEFVNESRRPVRFQPLREALVMAFALHGPEAATVCVLLTDDERMRELNAKWRGLDDTTDVLSFPAGDFPDAPLGDIAISVPCAKRQAEARGVALHVELAFLAVHGALHLLGFNDQDDESRRAMLAEMNRICIAVGMPEDEDWGSAHGEGEA